MKCDVRALLENCLEGSIVRLERFPCQPPPALLAMATVLKLQQKNAEKTGKGKKRALDGDDDDETEQAIAAPPQKKRNKQRVLLLSSRGVTQRMRHLMKDLECLLPHTKKGEPVIG